MNEFQRRIFSLCFVSDVYSCPVYYFPNRAGGFGHPSFVVEVNLKTPHFPNSHWVKRGTALLMNLDR